MNWKAGHPGATRIATKFIVAALSAVSIPCEAADRVWITVEAPFDGAERRAFQLETYVYRPSTGDKHPLLIFNHGSAEDPTQSYPSEILAEFFLRRGFMVVVPMRRGRGRSTGTSLEGMEKNCDIHSWQPGINGAFDDLTAVINYAQQLPNADPEQIVLVGASRGGFLSVAYSAEGAQRHKVKAVINFAGGWVAQTEDNCPTDFNLVSYKAFGLEARVPQMWLYGARDRYYARSSILAYVEAYASGGRNPMFELFEDAGHGLHFVPALWSDRVDQFLRDEGLGPRPGSDS